APFRRSIELDPKNFPGHLGLSSALIGTHDYAAAADAARLATAAGPRRPEGWVNLGIALNRSGQGAEAVNVLEEAVAAMPNELLLHTNLAAAINYRPEASPQKVFDTHKNTGRALLSGYGGGIRSFNNDSNPDRPLRIGYL